MNKLAPRWKGPFVVQKRMSKDGHPSVTYEITDRRNALKAYKGTLPAAPVSSRPSSVPADLGTSLTLAPPPLTALSGALPFRPPAPPHVSAQVRRKSPSVPIRTASQAGAPPFPHSPSSPYPPPDHADGLSSRLQVPLLVTSRCGRQIRRPLRYRDFVT